MSIHQSTTEITKQENSTQITDDINDGGLLAPTQSMSINPQTVEEGASYVLLDNYISILSNDELSGVCISNKADAISIKQSTTGIRGSNTVPSISEDCMDKAELDVVSIYDNNTEIRSTIRCRNKPNTNTKMKKVQAHIMSNKCKLALALLVGLVITVLVVSLIVWSAKSRDKENIQAEPVSNLTTINFTECWDKSVNYSERCNNSKVPELTDIKENITTSKNISLLTRQETTTRFGTSPENEKRTGK